MLAVGEIRGAVTVGEIRGAVTVGEIRGAVTVERDPRGQGRETLLSQ
jgi:hypothetical protein